MFHQIILLSKRLIRGGYFLCNISYYTGYLVARRMKFSYDMGLNQNGFRCVISANQNDLLNQSFLSRYWGFCWLELVNLNGQKWTKRANQHAFY